MVPTHGEIVMTSAGPCLVEMNGRAHGGNGSFLPVARALTGGYTQVDVTPDALLDEVKEEKLVSKQVGTVVGMPGFEKIRFLESSISLETSISIGSEVPLTVDVFTWAGSGIPVHSELSVLQRDVETVRLLEMKCGLFELADVTDVTAMHSGAVLDPVSTGAYLALEGSGR